ncbi:MAG: hypothetical protein M3P98_03905 [bacterium]|nr:hypothetical protein [bacterium]
METDSTSEVEPQTPSPERDFLPSAGRLAEVIGYTAARELFDEKERMERALRIRAEEKWNPTPAAQAAARRQHERRYLPGR